MGFDVEGCSGDRSSDSEPRSCNVEFRSLTDTVPGPEPSVAQLSDSRDQLAERTEGLAALLGAGLIAAETLWV
jgi:hypothetical protein